MCYSVDEVEWCGILFYRLEGTLEEPDEMKFDVIYLYPMHIGSGSHTEINDYEEVLDLYDEHPELEEDDVRHGFIHSHNSMDTFFSVTDKNQLKEGAETHDLFLSVITNNAQEYIAQISFRYEVETKKTLMGLFSTSEIVEKAGTMKCKLNYEACGSENDFINERLKGLREKKTEEARSNTTGFQRGTYGVHGYGTGNGSSGNSVSNSNGQGDIFETPEMSENEVLGAKCAALFPAKDFPNIYYNNSSRTYLPACQVIRAIVSHAGGNQYRIPVKSYHLGARDSCITAVNELHNDEKPLFTATKNPDSHAKAIQEKMFVCSFTTQEIIGALIKLDAIARGDINWSDEGGKTQEQLCKIFEAAYEAYSDDLIENEIMETEETGGTNEDEDS